jgi:hypothetical protein
MLYGMQPRVGAEPFCELVCVGFCNVGLCSLRVVKMG